MQPELAPPHTTPSLPRLLALAVALSLGAAVSLGITRFAYGLLLPTMRADLGWSYILAGAMNTLNALGYLLGALATPWLLKRYTPVALLVAGSLLASLFMAGSGFFTDAPSLLAQRLLAGVASALVFIAGGLLAARLGALAPGRMGLLLGVYYGGTGLGITLSGVMFGGVFFSVVASTTAMVRHNLPQSQWAAGISAFTIVFAAGQIVGPTVVGWIADGLGAGSDLRGLQRGLIFSALALWLGAAVAM